jgi:hypothetical protein
MHRRSNRGELSIVRKDPTEDQSGCTIERGEMARRGNGHTKDNQGYPALFITENARFVAPAQFNALTAAGAELSDEDTARWALTFAQ